MDPLKAFPANNYIPLMYAATQKGDILYHNDAGKAGNLDSELYGGTGKDVIISGNGNDVLHGGDGSDTILGGGGDDWIYGAGKNHDADFIDIGYTTDSDYLMGEEGNDTVQGGQGNDTLDGGVGDDSLMGGAGNDSLIGGDGNDKLYGEAGNDRMDGGAGNDTLDGGDGNDMLFGGAGDDSIMGGAGDDTLDGGLGADYLNGGAGFNVASYINAAAGVEINLLNTALNGGEATGDTYSNIQAFFGSNYGDTFYASNAVGAQFNGFVGNDLIYGNIQNDILNGGDGNDIIQGGAGTDTLYGGAGNDAYLFTTGEGYDVIVEYANEGTQDQLYCAADITGLSLARSGSDLYLFANDNDVAVLYGWFTNQAVEYVTLEASGYSYLVSDLVNAYLPQGNSVLMAMNDAAAPDYSDAQQIDFSEMPPVQLAGDFGAEAHTIAA